MPKNKQADRLALKKEFMLEAASRWHSAVNTGFKTTPLDNVPAKQIRQTNYAKRESLRSKLGMTEFVESLRRVEEAQIDSWDAVNLPPHSKAELLGKPVARILDGTESSEKGFGTGFLISDRLFMTNYHVFPDFDYAIDCEANFGFEYKQNRSLNPGVKFSLHPEIFFISHKALDFAIVAISNQSIDGATQTLSDLGCIPLIETPGKVILGEDINIIQYPLGGYKQYAYKQNQVVKIYEDLGYIQYLTDTAKASSGSPCFNRSWELAALHHCAIPLVENNRIITKNNTVWDEKDEDDVRWVSNEGISISRIIQYLKNNLSAFETPNIEYLHQLLRHVSDPLLRAAGAGGTEIIVQEAEAKPKHINNMDKSNVTFNFYSASFVNIYTSPTQSLDKLIESPNEVIPQQPTPEAQPPIQFDEDYESREDKGYKADFLDGYSIEEPLVDDSRMSEIYMDGSEPYLLKYYNYSLVMNKKRRFCMWTAANVNYSADVRTNKSREDFGRDTWRRDPRVPDMFQVIGSELYAPAKRVEQGHVVRRDDTCWGPDEEWIEFANSDTFHYTNCTPQLEPFNRENPRANQGYTGIHGIWGALEEHIKKQLSNVDNKATIFAGPQLASKDPIEDFGSGNIKYPLKFWKVALVLDENGELFSYGFWLDQTDVVRQFGLGLERLDVKRFKKQQLSIREISRRTGVDFDEQVYQTDVLRNNAFTESDDRSIPYKEVSEIQIRPQQRKED